MFRYLMFGNDYTEKNSHKEKNTEQKYKKKEYFIMEKCCLQT